MEAFRIGAKDPEISGSNPEKGGLVNQAELVRATSECEYVVSHVRGHHVPFWVR